LGLIGEVRYGVLAVIWVVFGYFGVFEFGLSRATANHMARMRDDSAASREALFWTALMLNLAIGAVGAAGLVIVGHVLLTSVLDTSPALRAEALAAVPWLAAGVPATTVSLVLAGTLEGRERFLTVNVLTVVGLALFQLVPLGYAYWIGSDLRGLIVSAMAALLASTAVSFIATAVSLPVAGWPRLDRSRIGSLFRYGGWITITGLVSPLLTLLDRVVIGAVLGAQSVTRYTIPYTLVARTQILPMSLARTLFPRFSMLDEAQAAAVARSALRALSAVVTVLTVTASVVLEPFLRVWVGDDIARGAAPVGAILLLGMWFNSLAVIPFVFLQARRRPDLPAKFHVLEVGPYLAALWAGLKVSGIEGAAWAWTGRAMVDCALLFTATAKVSRTSTTCGPGAILPGAAMVLLSCSGALASFSEPFARILTGPFLVAIAAAWAWRVRPRRWVVPTTGSVHDATS
jgi:O-antigen/teichoic acid export membrane protein